MSEYHPKSMLDIAHDALADALSPGVMESDLLQMAQAAALISIAESLTKLASAVSEDKAGWTTLNIDARVRQ